MKVKSTLFFFILLIISGQLRSQVSKNEFEELKGRVEMLKNENEKLKNELSIEIESTRRNLEGYAPMFMLLFLYATICALWAQGTGRHAILWFFTGLIFSVIAALVVLYINGKEIGDNN